MSDKNIDYLGDEMPPGYEPWSCDVCTAVCNFEAMTMCKRPPDCGFDRDQPESNGGAFGFMKRGSTGENNGWHRPGCSQSGF